MLRDGQRCLGSHKVVAGVMAMSAHLTQDAGRAHTESKEIKKENSNLHSEQRYKEKKLLRQDSLAQTRVYLHL